MDEQMPEMVPFDQVRGPKVGSMLYVTVKGVSEIALVTQVMVDVLLEDGRVLRLPYQAENGNATLIGRMRL